MSGQKKPVLIIGSGGFTGRYVFQVLQRSANFLPISGKDAGIDIRKIETVDAAIEKIKPAGIINLAAVSTLDLDNIPLIYEMNAYAIIEILDLLRKKGFTGRFVNASSALVYGSNTPKLICEEHPLDPEHHFAVAKVMADQAMGLYREHIDAIAARPFNCIGLGHKASFVVPKIISHFQKRAEEIVLGTTSVKRDFVDIRDVARMYEAVLNADNPNPILNFCSGRATSIDDIVETLRVITGHPIKVGFDKTLTRAVENPLMCGDNRHLLALPFEYHYSLRDTLSWMLKGGVGDGE